MAVWNKDNILVTQKGQELLAKVQLGDKALTITKILAGGTSVSPSQLYAQTGVTNSKQTLIVKEKRSSETGSVIEVQLNNETLATSYTLRQIGIYASHPDMGEVLYMIAQCDEPADVIPTLATTPLIMGFSFYLKHSSDLVLNVSINHTGVATIADLDALKTYLATIYVDFTDIIDGGTF